ncbi:outer membrane receptor for ferrienterochelin and colicin [Novosphingobium kunmingense]|uniref:Outer membrane receptor for ferrienterochelin and colicin n=1 Tax=Novosphingobium kunmingense TaxID=1211806 RepID=A0A2N0H5R2_9SPHN|nr:TonB-dependent receptor [Novosphingobium kunmingense]PKB14279.1 outer membrane receptor for ferrienterochelin and colicin [Novosphingobium kunmingense]
MSLKSKAIPTLLAGVALALVPQVCAAQAAASEAEDTPSKDDPGDSAKGQTIVVTGSRIRGAVAASDMTTLPRDAIVSAGQVDLGEATRALPQNFGGGQNPGVGTGAGFVNANVNSASNVNLRGLGADATLTLLNSHRLPYDSAFGGVDISAIPLAAVDRIEVMPDGASAIYGSDAVAGVVNVILRRDFEGIEASAQLGASTDGGNFRQQADLVTGARWSGGGMMLAYDYAHNSQITARQRSYSGSLDPVRYLYPSQRHHAATLSAHQDLGGGLTASIDVLYARRTSEIVGGTASARFRFSPEVETFTVAPSFELKLGSDWSAKLVGVLGRDRTQLSTLFTPTPGTATLTTGCYCNRASSVELGLEGPLFALAGGDARVAFGGGYRSNGMAFTRVVAGTPSAAFDVSRRNYFAYGEVFLPFIAPANGVRAIDRLSLSASLRYEDYPGMARLATPRLGLVYAPVPDLTLRGTWSRSFKAPSLFQQYLGYEVFLLPASRYGAGPAGTTLVYASGGNPDLKPEHARSWTAGFDFHPQGVPGLTVSATWFDVRYRDRVLRPIAGSPATAFRDPGYASLIDYSPSAQALDSLIAGALYGLENFSGQAYDSTQVAAYLDNRNINVAVQAIRGVDARLAWRKDLGGDRRVSLDVSGAWLDTSQQVTPDLPVVQLAGTVFNPPEFRLRASASLQSHRSQVSLAVNYTGTLEDRRFATVTRLPGSATVDLSARYTLIEGEDDRPRLSLSLSVSNLFNDKPEPIGVTGPTDTPYDSTNYSPIGRFIAVGVRGYW